MWHCNPLSTLLTIIRQHLPFYLHGPLLTFPPPNTPLLHLQHIIIGQPPSHEMYDCYYIAHYTFMTLLPVLFINSLFMENPPPLRSIIDHYAALLYLQYLLTLKSISEILPLPPLPPHQIRRIFRNLSISLWQIQLWSRNKSKCLRIRRNFRNFSISLWYIHHMDNGKMPELFRAIFEICWLYSMQIMWSPFSKGGDLCVIMEKGPHKT